MPGHFLSILFSESVDVGLQVAKQGFNIFFFSLAFAVIFPLVLDKKPQSHSQKQHKKIPKNTASNTSFSGEMFDQDIP